MQIPTECTAQYELGAETSVWLAWPLDWLFMVWITLSSLKHGQGLITWKKREAALRVALAVTG